MKVKHRGTRRKVLLIIKLKKVWSTRTTSMLIHRKEFSCCHVNLVLSDLFSSFFIQILILIILLSYFICLVRQPSCLYLRVFNSHIFIPGAVVFQNYDKIIWVTLKCRWNRSNADVGSSNEPWSYCISRCKWKWTSKYIIFKTEKKY